MIAFIDVIVYFQTELAPCTGHELPHSGSAGGRFGKWVKCAFYNGKVFEIIRYAICL